MQRGKKTVFRKSLVWTSAKMKAIHLVHQPLQKTVDTLPPLDHNIFLINLFRFTVYTIILPTTLFVLRYSVVK